VDFRLSEDQRDLRDAVRTLLAKAAGPEAVRAAMAGPLGRDERLWRQITQDLGLTGLSVPEEHGGAGATFAEVAVVLEELGAVLLPSPYLSTVVAVEVLKRSALAPRFLPLLAAGGTAAVADAEPGDRSWPPRLDSQATPDGARWRLNGGKAAVPDAAGADVLLVTAHAGGGPALFAVAGGAPGLSATDVPLLDQTRRAADLALADVPAVLVGGDDEVARARDVRAVATAVEAVGSARRALELTVEHLRTREQFGRVLGSFQALRHRAADLFTTVEAAASTARYAALCVDAAPGELPAAAPLAKLVSAQALTDVAAEMVQLHGGIAITWEHDAHLYLKRAAAVQLTGGTPEQLRRVLAPAAGL
jgi:alkylation response protein AidB-like acyl-CoA dehydrogenase